MSQKNINPAERVTIRQLRDEGLSFHKISRKIHRSLEYVRKACEDMPLPEKAINYRVGRFIGANPTLTNEQVAEKLGMTVEFIQERRRKMNPKFARKNDQKPADDDKIDRGKRVSGFWLRQHCSRGERTKWQLQALLIASGFQFNLIEVVRSAERAGLVVEKRTGLIRASVLVESH